MPNRPTPSDETTPSLGWARRVLGRQLDTLSRLAGVAWRLMNPAPQPPEPLSATTVSAGIRGLEKALRQHVRIAWALRLIEALRAKLVADLQALDNGQPPSLATDPPGEARSFAPDAERPETNEALRFTEMVERAERAERPERERFGFEGRRSDDELAEILKRPTDEVIALICRELGLPPDWLQVAKAAWSGEATADDSNEPPGGPASGSELGSARILAAPS